MQIYNLFIEKNLPPSLSDQELYYYLEKKNNGDKEARNYIIEHNIRLVMHRIHRRFKNTKYEEQELASIGLIGLIKSVDTFDINKNYSFSTYATKCIDNEILYFMRNNKKYINDESIYTTIISDNQGKEKKYIDVFSDPNENLVLDYENKILYEEVKKIVYDLPDKEKNLMILYFGFDNNRIHTQVELSKLFNSSQANICRIINKTLKKIKYQLQEKELFENNEKYLNIKKQK